jgi:hypothetical protein
MQRKLFFLSMLALTAALFVTSAGAETISGKVLAITKGSKVTAIEIAPDVAGSPPAYRCTVSTTFQEIADMLLQAMEAKTAVTISSSESCKLEGAVRDCGSIVTAEAVKK